MCGICGTTMLTESSRNILSILAWEMESRGRDSWGATDGREIVKRVGPITESYNLPREWESAIIHTRAATHGSKKNEENAHPFFFRKADGSEIIGVHNGLIRNHEELNKRYNRNFDVDSMHIYAHRAEGKSWEELRGYGALVWWEDGKMNLTRFNHYDLHAATLEGGELVFCSLYTPLERAARFLGNPVKKKWEIKEYYHYTIGTEEDEGGVRNTLVENGELPFFRTVVQSSSRGTCSGGTSGGTTSYFNGTFYTSGSGSNISWTWDTEKKCYSCRREEVDRKKVLFCEGCFKKILDEWKVISGYKVEG